MKAVFFLILFFIVQNIGYSQNIAVVQDSIPIYADSITQTINLQKNEFLSGIYCDQGLADTLLFDVQDVAGSWYRLSDGGADYPIKVDSSQATYNNVSKDIFDTIKRLRMIIKADIADTTYIRFDKKPYY